MSAVARRTLLLAMPAAVPLAGSPTPAGFGRGPSVGDLFARVRELDEAITTTILADRDDGPAQDERLRVVDRIASTPARDVTGCRIKAELVATLLEDEDEERAAAMADALLADLDRLEQRTG